VFLVPTAAPKIKTQRAFAAIVAVPSGQQSRPPPAGRTGALPPKSLVNNRYLFTRKVGQGGMAAVYDAIDNRTGWRVALKEMSDAAITLPAERQQAIAQFKGVGILA
jgi:hypothetical protein